MKAMWMQKATRRLAWTSSRRLSATRALGSAPAKTQSVSATKWTCLNPNVQAINTQFQTKSFSTQVTGTEFKVERLEGEHEGMQENEEGKFLLQWLMDIDALLHRNRCLYNGSLKVEKCFGTQHGSRSTYGLRMPDAERKLSLNCFLSCVTQMQTALDSVRFDPTVRTVVLKSDVEKVFCAGADLKERATMTQQEVSQFVSGLRSAFSGMENLPMPTIAAIEGAALGGGLELALACDFRIGGGSAVLGLPETSLAIIPGAGGTQRLPRLIGSAKAKELIFTARRLSADQAKDYGVVEYSVDAGSAYSKALELAKEITPNGPVALRMAKEAVSRGMQTDVATGMEIEKNCYAQIIPTKDRLEGIQAFKEKRKPSYTGE